MDFVVLRLPPAGTLIVYVCLLLLGMSYLPWAAGVLLCDVPQRSALELDLGSGARTYDLALDGSSPRLGVLERELQLSVREGAEVDAMVSWWRGGVVLPGRSSGYSIYVDTLADPLTSTTSMLGDAPEVGA